MTTTAEESRGNPEVELLIPEVEEASRRRRRRTGRRAASCGAVIAVLIVIALIAAGAAGDGPARNLLGSATGTPPWQTVDSGKGLTEFPQLELSQISCPIAGACVAVGSELRGGQSRLAFVEQHGSLWGPPVAGPVLRGAGLGSERIACSSDDCLVGDGQGLVALISRSHDRWTSLERLPFPNPSGTSLLQMSSACTRGGTCWLVVKRNVLAKHQPRVLSYAVGESDGHWLRRSLLGESALVDGRRPFAVLVGGIDCWGAASCTLVGSLSSTTGADTFLQTERSGAWQAPLLAPERASHVLPSIRAALSCTSVGTCVIAGFDSAPGRASAVELVVGGRWGRPMTGIGATARFSGSQVTDVACYSASLCVAAGEAYESGGNSSLPFAEIRRNGRWLAPHVMTNLDELNPFVSGVACPTSTTCEVVGNLGTTVSRTFLASWNGDTWRSGIATLDGTSASTWTSDLSCTAGTCWVVGDVHANSNSPSGVVFRFPTS
jgi:hypothetical protein